MADERDKKAQTDREPYDEEQQDTEGLVDENQEQVDSQGEAEDQEAAANDTETNWQQVAQDRYDQLVRLQADFDNYRRRVDREREELRGYVTGAILGDFLPVYDNLERALKYMPDTDEAKAWRMGVEMTLKGFNDVLTKFGVTPIPTVGTIFDPRVHEAVQRVDSDEPEGTIIEELLKGFQWKDRVLRASLVKVSTGQGTPEAQKSQTDSAS
ncbi:nucleotide exchange factor GrpE [Sulfobacillus thermosulfidooxidans]|uniref:Protein GrpE n=1 Tax=Sulfobacillus thermosulfidooxidans (strain DSM 9293 / VKM B-1269 / AT-1) TaxID=929705 RepID=A0A1W1W8B2_SULTA|nr:nucleotide exchange factor GrpE [Sulfobacillus thermosulfidooxidans]OLZ10461.1 nucleotide exchange factor GrpE [Sulfobacillus thermosulfidooxidans]OLZ14283.1 nucleotide exchange factor GrpE [Sulfobacillus thermosulfidooxidans]OLZ19026.1 nucleotide exchange factor GrpE [Sulfobacillus thermosulfidooxidans]SMC02527.1 molecular chaperone GrpE [Sulfobacillus thermosulfidooxidans DSM 9293]